MNKKLLHSLRVIVSISLLSKILAFISEAILATYIGTSYQADAYYMVAGIQNVFYPMLSVGIWKVFLPEYKKNLHIYDSNIADSIANKMVSLLIIVSIALSAFIFLFSNSIISIVAPGFSSETKVLSIELLRIASPLYIFIALSSIYAAMLQSHNNFFGSQIREVVSYIPIIFSTIFLYPRFGISSLAIALVISSIFRLIFELPFINWGYKFKFDLKLNQKDIKLMLKRLPSALLTAGIIQINSFVDKMMASALPTGAVASLNYGHRLQNVFAGLLSTSISTATYPIMAQYVAEKDYDSLKKMIVNTILIMAVMIIPISIACVLFRKELVSIAFMRGKFDLNSMITTSSVFGAYCIGLLFSSTYTLITNVFYCFGDTKITMRISLMNLLINILLNIIFVNFMGVTGLALATSCSIIIANVASYILLKKYVNINIRAMLIEVIKIFTSALGSCGLAYVMVYKINSNILKLIIAIPIAIVVYFLGLKFSKSEPYALTVEYIKNKLKNKILS